MAEMHIGHSPYFARGIESIVTGDPKAASHLPETRKLLPLEDAGRSMLDKLLTAPTYDAFLDEAIRPVVDDLAQLSPRGFTEGLSAARTALARAGERIEDARSPDARVLARAQRLLDEHLELRALAQMYANALVAG